MSIFVALLSLFSLTLGIGSAGAAFADEEKDLLAKRVENLASYTEHDHRISVKIKDCLYISERWEALLTKEEILTGIVTIDLSVTELILPHPMRQANDDALANGTTPPFRDGGGAIAYLGEGDGVYGILYLSVNPPLTILREEHIGRTRTKNYIRLGKTRPSPRADGKTYVFRDSLDLSIHATGPKRVKQLEDFEKALLEYQEKYCPKLMS